MISAIVLAAGLSNRMGQPKMLMPWGKTCVVDQVISSLIEAEINDIYLIAGGLQSQLKMVLKNYQVNYIHNEDYANGEMLTSVQIGIKGLGKDTDAALIVLGDQPKIESRNVRKIAEKFNTVQSKIIVPSYRMHRGHPWLVGRSYWQEILDLHPPLTLQNFLNRNSHDIDYIIVETSSVIEDLDTQDDYNRYKP
jgi:molybdenum cofactor cytidylyltransferase